MSTQREALKPHIRIMKNSGGCFWVCMDSHGYKALAPNPWAAYKGWYDNFRMMPAPYGLTSW